MKKPVVDYRTFRFSKLNQPEFSHLKLLCGWIVYFVLYFLTENLISPQTCYVVHSKLDDLIPFCEIFVIPYVGWYLLIIATLVYFALYDTDGFKRFQVFIIVCQMTAMVIYILFPNMQDLRPQTFERDNILTRLVGLLYTFDTNTNVCPSMHVAYSIGIASAWIKQRNVSKLWRFAVVVFAVLICLSTAFIKQHSVLDAFAAIPLCILAEIVAYKIAYRKK